MSSTCFSSFPPTLALLLLFYAEERKRRWRRRRRRNERGKDKGKVRFETRKLVHPVLSFRKSCYDREGRCGCCLQEFKKAAPLNAASRRCTLFTTSSFFLLRFSFSFSFLFLSFFLSFFFFFFFFLFFFIFRPRVQRRRTRERRRKSMSDKKRRRGKKKSVIYSSGEDCLFFRRAFILTPSPQAY